VEVSINRLIPRLAWLALLFFPSLLWADEGHHHALTQDEIGSVNFATSCSHLVTADFNRAVALLHSFQYEQSREIFEAIAKNDPGCAMAEWGIAMSHYHGLWQNGDIEAGRVALQKAKEIASSNKNTTTREKGYIDAIGEIYEQDGSDQAAHAQGFQQKLAQLHEENPNDSEAAIFYALSLDISSAKTDRTFAKQRQCGEILEPIFVQYPHHPGVAHYIIHCYDNPALAEKGLGAARAYAKIAPASAHAQHMPSHIFTRVGSWDESIESNHHAKLSAVEAEKTSSNGEARDQRLHAMDYLEYAYLQTGLDRQAKSIRDETNSLSPVPGLTLTGNYAASAIPARYAVERRHWRQAAELKPDSNAVPWAQALTWVAVGEGAARSSDIDRAKKAEQTLASLRDRTNEMKNEYWANQIEVQRREVSAWILQAREKQQEAIATMTTAAELEESMDKDAVTPGAITPAREMLGELLSLSNQPQQALAQYEAVLHLTPNRFNALYGAATAAESAGEATKASMYYRKLTEIATSNDRPELVSARNKLTVANK
jgi:tetratricopeptide (TPR) repeat protein